MTKLFQEKLNPILKPTEKASNAIELVFDKIHSLINIDTAHKVNIGRSWGYQMIHLSEIAFFRNADTIMTAIMQTLPDNMFVFVALESTGNGIGGYFYNKIQESLEGLSDYDVFFIPWYKHPGYIRKLPDEKVEWYSDHPNYGNEKMILERLKDIPDIEKRMWWRRWNIRNKCDNKLKTFKQEMPETLEESFQSAGVSKFDFDKVNELMKLCKDSKMRGVIDANGNFRVEDNW